MKPEAIVKTIQLPDGREISIETGRLAKQAHGSVVVRMGNTMLLATVVSAYDAKDGVDFLPLSVDYQEKFAAAGRIPGGFLKRESRLSDYEVLICRLVDRAMRPLFPSDYHADTQILVTLISADMDAEPDCLAALAASAAVSVSDIPFDGPISEVRVILVDGKHIINPTPAQSEKAELNLVVAATIENIMMVEGEMKETSEAKILDALKAAHDAIKVQCEAQLELVKAMGGVTKRTYCHEINDEAAMALVMDVPYKKMYEVANSQLANKNARKEAFSAVKADFFASLPAEHGYNKDMLKRYLHDAEKKACRDVALFENKRLDGRAFDEVRFIWSEVDYLPSAHGSALFTRGETQSLTSVTLGTKLDEQLIDSAMKKGTNKFMLHYNFPSFSTGEVKPSRGPGRREIGHGNLANRALRMVLPSEKEMPYTVRVVSDILESNGSSSMATVCAGCLALMDAGVQIKAPVSGIAMGMISDPKTGKYVILSDILGDEDHLGDMDFKVTGTEAGITACQMDIKVDGLSYEMLAEALDQAKRGRLHILGEMKKTLDKPNSDYKPHAPRVTLIEIESSQIGAVIGPGGKVIQEIQKNSGATIIIEEVGNKGMVRIFANDSEAMSKALRDIREIVALPEVDEIYDGIVKTVTTFGAFVEFMKGKEGLLHISDISWERLETMDGVFQNGEQVRVKLLDIDKKTGKFKLSRKALLPRPKDMPEQQQRAPRPAEPNRRN